MGEIDNDAGRGPTSQPSKSDDDGRGQALQINENTIDDPEPPAADLDDDLHSRSDVPDTDQALQINENTIDDKE